MVSRVIEFPKDLAYITPRPTDLNSGKIEKAFAAIKAELEDEKGHGLLFKTASTGSNAEYVVSGPEHPSIAIIRMEKYPGEKPDILIIKTEDVERPPLPDPQKFPLLLEESKGLNQQIAVDHDFLSKLKDTKAMTKMTAAVINVATRIAHNHGGKVLPAQQTHRYSFDSAEKLRAAVIALSNRLDINREDPRKLNSSQIGYKISVPFNSETPLPWAATIRDNNGDGQDVAHITLSMPTAKNNFTNKLTLTMLAPDKFIEQAVYMAVNGNNGTEQTQRTR